MTEPPAANNQGCLTASPEADEVRRWLGAPQEQVAQRLLELSKCYAGAAAASDVYVAFRRQSETRTEAWITGSSTDDCRITECITAQLSSLKLPAPPRDMPPDAEQDVSLTLSYDPAATPALRLGPPPGVLVAAEGPCVDRSRLPKDEKLPAARIQAAMRGALPGVQRCYERALAANAEITGDTVILFAIGLDGSVEKLQTMSNSLPDCALVDCITEVARGLRFDRPRGGTVEFVYSFRFERR